MRISESIAFNENDKKLYELNKNKEFLCWYKKVTEHDDYHPYLGLYNMQNLINRIIRWYEIKFADKLINISTDSYDDTNIHDISNVLTWQRFIYRLNHRETEALSCKYRPKIIYIKNATSTSLNYGRPEVLSLTLDEETGKINKYDLEIINMRLTLFDNDITVDQMYQRLSDLGIKNVDYQLLKRCFDTHNNDLKIRNQIMNAAAEGLLYSKETITEEKGAFRARQFVKEMKHEYPNIEFLNDYSNVFQK